MATQRSKTTGVKCGRRSRKVLPGRGKNTNNKSAQLEVRRGRTKTLAINMGKIRWRQDMFPVTIQRSEQLTPAWLFGEENNEIGFS